MDELRKLHINIDDNMLHFISSPTLYDDIILISLVTLSDIYDNVVDA